MQLIKCDSKDIIKTNAFVWFPQKYEATQLFKWYFSSKSSYSNDFFL